MALIRFEHDMQDDEEDFKDSYDEGEVAGGFENFIKAYGDDIITIDMTGKVLISVDSMDGYFGKDKNLPINIMTLFYDEGTKHKYKPSLIYAGHIAFLKIAYEDGRVSYFYKDDECYPQTLHKFLEDSCSTVYHATERKFTQDDIKSQIEMLMNSRVDFRYKIDPEEVIVLEGL